MLIQRDQLIVGRPATEVRNLMRELRQRSHSTRGLADTLDITRIDAERLILDLLAADLIELCEGTGPLVIADDEDMGSAALYSTTISGNALGKARIGVPMIRAKAQVLLDGVLDRAVAINVSDEWLHWVDEIVLYGSFSQPGEQLVGDIDLGVRLHERHTNEEYLGRQDEMIERDDARPSTHIDRICYAQRKVIRHLRGRSSRVDLVELRGDRSLPPNAEPVPVYKRVQ